MKPSFYLNSKDMSVVNSILEVAQLFRQKADQEARNILNNLLKKGQIGAQYVDKSDSQ